MPLRSNEEGTYFRINRAKAIHAVHAIHVVDLRPTPYRNVREYCA